MNARRSTPTDSQPGGAVEGRASSDARVTYGRLLLTLVATLLLSGVIVAFGNGGGGEPRVDPERAANPTPETVAERSTTSSSTTTSTFEKKPEPMNIAKCLSNYAVGPHSAQPKLTWYLAAAPNADEISISSKEPLKSELQPICGGESFRFCGRASGGSLRNKQGAQLVDGGIIKFEKSPQAKLRVDALRDCRSPAPPISQQRVPDSFPKVGSGTSPTRSGSANEPGGRSSTSTASNTTTDPSPDPKFPFGGGRRE